MLTDAVLMVLVYTITAIATGITHMYVVGSTLNVGFIIRWHFKTIQVKSDIKVSF